MLRKVRKATAQRYYQLLTGHAVIGSLHDRMTGPQQLESEKCWWCNRGKRQTRYHLFTECRAWTLQIRALWSSGKGLPLGAPEGAGAAMAMEGGGHGGGFGIFGEGVGSGWGQDSVM